MQRALLRWALTFLLSSFLISKALNLSMPLAKKRGFTIRKSNAYFSQKLKAITRREFTCSKHGKPSLKQDENVRNRRSTRTGCRARLYISLEEGCWIVKFFEDSHNHTLLAEEEVLLMPYHRKFNDIAKQRILQMRRSGMPTKSIREILRIEMNNPSLQPMTYKAMYQDGLVR